MKSQLNLISMNGEGDDRNLAQDGNNRYYWYSVRDVMTLLVNIRKESLTYNNRPEAVLGEEYSSLRENDQSILIADPQHSANFNDYLSNDIDKIIGVGNVKSNVWVHMPSQIIIPLLSGLHWRVIRIQIDYGKRTVSVLWDDPYGNFAFPEQLKNELRASIIYNVSKLICKETNVAVFILSAESINERDKVTAQQPLGENSWDCGPITVSNIRDYIKHFAIENSHFTRQHYTVPEFSKLSNYDLKIVTLRKEHIIQFSSLSEIPISSPRLEEIRKSVSMSHDTAVTSFTKYREQISQLPSDKIDMLFAVLDNHRQVFNEVTTTEYSDNEIEYALNFINKPIEIRRLSGSFESEVAILDSNMLNKILKEKMDEFKLLIFATGTDNFAKIIQEKREFVDKSLLIKEIIESGDEVALITRPRRWGKTTNLEMLRSFLAIEADRDGKQLTINHNKKLFRHLMINNELDIIDQHQGKYPVIFISFKNIKANNYNEIVELLRNEIIELYEQHEYLKNSDKLNEYQGAIFNKYLSGDIDEVGLKMSLKNLSKFLYKHFSTKVYLLIDEYDTPLNYAYSISDYHNVLDLIRSMLGIVLKGNNYLKQSVVTGITKIAKAGLFSDINNVRDYSILHPKYAQYFGFTKEEVEELLIKANIKEHAIKVAIKEWYNGYQIGNYIIYNPWSIAIFFRDMQIGSYWVNTESMVLGDRRLSSDLLVTDEMQEQVKMLISNCKEGNKQTIEININPEIIFTNLKEDPTAVWTLLVYSGYLSLSDPIQVYGSVRTYRARIPNKEVLDIYEDSIVLWIKGKLSLNNSESKFIDNLLNDFNLEDFDKVLKTITQVINKYNDRIAQENESIFHSLIEVICLLGGKNHILSAEKKSGTGRIDSIFYPLIDKSEKIIIHEYKILKKTNKEEEINAKIQEALWQVYERSYLEEVMTKYQNFKYVHYQNVEVRAMVILVDENNRNFAIKIGSILHSIADSCKILEFFRITPEIQLTKLKNKFLIQEVIEVIQDTANLNEIAEKIQLKKSVNFDITNEVSDDIVFQLGKVMRNNKIAKKLVEDYGPSLFHKSEQELCRISGIAKKRARDIIEIAEQYKKIKESVINTQQDSVKNDEQMDTIVNAVFEIKYDNPIFNHPNLAEILKIAKEKTGAVTITKLMQLQTSEVLKLSKIETEEAIVDIVFEQNYFLSNKKGQEFICTVANKFDEQTLITILELGQDKDIAQQIITESEIQGIEKILNILLGKELPISGTTDNLKRILSQDELNQLKLIPNGILNSWSNKAYHKIADYIDSLAKTLDDMLNIGKSGNQVAITIALLEEWLGFAASGQRFEYAVPPHYDPNSDDDWSNGGGGGSSFGGNNNSSDNSNGFTGILPLYNGTDFNITDQM